MATIDPIVHPYPDFQDGDIINPEQFDANNQATRDKVNEIIVELNTNVAKDGEFLATDNTDPYTPTEPYHPSTKKYVDDSGVVVLQDAATYTDGEIVTVTEYVDSQIANVEIGTPTLYNSVTTVSAISITTGIAFPYEDGRYIQFIADADITAPATIEIDGGTTLAAKDIDGVDIDIIANVIYLVAFQDGAPDTFLLTPNVSVNEISDTVDELAARGETVQTSETAFTLALEDGYKMIWTTADTPVTITIPDTLVIDFPPGTEITFVQGGDGAITFAPGNNITIFSLDDNLTIAGKYAAATLKKSFTFQWVLIGALV